MVMSGSCRYNASLQPVRREFSQALLDAASQRILVLDGACGTMLQRQGLTEECYRAGRRELAPERIGVPLLGNNDILALTCPSALSRVHELYLQAGADIVETCTFGAQCISQADYATQDLCYEMNVAAARVAKEMTLKYSALTPARPRWVAGSIGPTNKTLSMSPDVNDPGFRAVTFEAMAAAYREQVRGLLDGGVDLLILETIFDTLNAKAAIFAMNEEFAARGERVPLIISATVTDRSGRMLCGQNVEAFWYSVRHANPLAVGLNCALGAEEMRPHLELLNRISDCGVSCYPNAGLPNETGGYDQTPAQMAAVLRGYAQNGWLNVVGGCCGTDPEYIKAIAAQMEGLAPREVQPDTAEAASVSRALCLSGLEPFLLSPDKKFTMIGERTNLWGSAKFARLIREGDFEGALNIARRQVENGAAVIDINLDDAMHDSVAVMCRFLRLLAAEPAIAKVPVMLDSSHWEVLEAGLKCLQGRSLVNSLSLKEGEAEFRRRAAIVRSLGAVPVVMAFDEQGQAETAERKLAVCTRAYKILLEEGFPPRQIVFDPAVLAVATGMPEHADYANAFIEAVGAIKAHLPGAAVLGGISNVSFALRGHNAVREAMHSVFLHYAIAQGLDMGIVNAGMLRLYGDIPADLLQGVEDVILNRRPDATERLLALAQIYKREGKSPSAEKLGAWRDLPVRERLVYAMVNGLDEYAAADSEEACQELKAAGGRALDCIEGPLMDGIKKVGVLFGQGDMFLPQVIKSARVMKKCVAALMPFLEDEKAGSEAGSAGRGRVLLATVKGDVHDIGKNIVSVVLACNGFKVDDMGVMVPCADILDRAQATGAQAVGLSALITPSLAEMEGVAREMERRGMTCPLVLGGAAASARHTAIRVAPLYSGPVIYVPDASRASDAFARMLDPQHCGEYFAQVRAEQAELRSAQSARAEGQKLLSLEEARKLAPSLDFSAASLAVPPQENRGLHLLEWQDPSEFLPLVDWRQFLAVWDIKGSFPAVLNDAEKGTQARELLAAARSLLEEVTSKGLLKAKALYGLFPAASRREDILVFADDKRTLRAVLPTLRRQLPGELGPWKGKCPCAADFLVSVDEEGGARDWLGAMLVTCGLGVEELCARYKRQHDEYRAIMLKNLADRLVEALAESLHARIRREWGCGEEAALSAEELRAGRYRGIRPAPGYPILPDHFLKRTVFSLLNAAEKLPEVTLTGSCALRPAASICALIMAHPQAAFFPVGPVGRDQLADYASRCSLTVEEAARRLAALEVR